MQEYVPVSAEHQADERPYYYYPRPRPYYPPYYYPYPPYPPYPYYPPYYPYPPYPHPYHPHGHRDE